MGNVGGITMNSNRVFYGILAVFVIIILSTVITSGKSDDDNIYATTAIVTTLDYVNDTVVVEDFNGFMWEFTGIEDWCEGDLVSLVMNSVGTPTVLDDKIVHAYYSGTVNWFDDGKCNMNKRGNGGCSPVGRSVKRGEIK